MSTDNIIKKKPTITCCLSTCPGPRSGVRTTLIFALSRKPEARQRWIDALEGPQRSYRRLDDDKASLERYRVCSRHFRLSDFKNSEGPFAQDINKITLRPDAVPLLYVNPLGLDTEEDDLGDAIASAAAGVSLKRFSDDLISIPSPKRRDKHRKSEGNNCNDGISSTRNDKLTASSSPSSISSVVCSRRHVGVSPIPELLSQPIRQLNGLDVNLADPDMQMNIIERIAGMIGQLTHHYDQIPEQRKTSMALKFQMNQIRMMVSRSRMVKTSHMRSHFDGTTGRFAELLYDHTDKFFYEKIRQMGLFVLPHERTLRKRAESQKKPPVNAPK